MSHFRFFLESGVHKIGNPETLFKFIKWVDQRRPYDLVIDGLNAFHCTFKPNTKIGDNSRNNVSFLRIFPYCLFTSYLSIDAI